MVNGKRAREVIQIHWRSPATSKSKLNVDGSCKTNSWKITAGCLLRDLDEQNRDVDHLASLGYDLPFGLLNFKSAQDSISNILLNDVLGRAFERAVIC
ncbi:unnamed protein product [Prunus armeniaca]